MKMNCIIALGLAMVYSVKAETIGGPKGGKLLVSEPQHAEFYVRADRNVEIIFYDTERNPVAPSGQVVNIFAEAPTGKIKLELEERNGSFISKEALPEGDGYNVVVQIRATPEAKPQNFRIALHMETCEGCQRAEYGCICGHGAEEEHGHEH